MLKKSAQYVIIALEISFLGSTFLYMTRAELIDYICLFYGATAEHPFDTDQSITVFRHADNRKWFAIIMTVPKNKLVLGAVGDVDIVNLKVEREMTCSLWQENGIFPAYHMSKAHWISAFLDGSVDDGTLEWLISVSFKLTETKKKRSK